MPVLTPGPTESGGLAERLPPRAVVIEPQHPPGNLPLGGGDTDLRAGEHGVRFPFGAHARESPRKEATITCLERGEQPPREGGAVDPPAGGEAERAGLRPQRR